MQIHVFFCGIQCDGDDDFEARDCETLTFRINSELPVSIEDAIYIDSAREVEVTEDPNYHADLAVVAIRRTER